MNVQGRNMTASHSSSLLNSKKNGILQLEATQDTFPSHGGLYSSERTTLETCWVLLSPQPRWPRGHSPGLLCFCHGIPPRKAVGRVSSLQAWPQESKLLKEHPQEGCTPGGEKNPSWRKAGFATTKSRCRSSSACGW